MTYFTGCDMHVHTEYSHDCNTRLYDIQTITRKLGLIIAITDHNRIGGSLAARAMGIPTIPAIEVTTKNNKDILVYFHEYDDLIEFYQQTVKPAINPGLIWEAKTTLTELEVLLAAKKYGALTSLAHPYAPFKKSADLTEEEMTFVDAIEVMNFAMSKKANQKAAQLCDTTHKIHTAGSDSHHPSTIGRVTVKTNADSPKEFLKETMQGLGVVVGYQRKNKDVYQKVKHYLATRG